MILPDAKREMDEIAAGVRRLARLHWASMRRLALRTGLETGVGIRAIRAGAYTAADMLMVAGLDDAAAVKEYRTLFQKVMPPDRDTTAFFAGMAGMESRSRRKGKR